MYKTARLLSRIRLGGVSSRCVSNQIRKLPVLFPKISINPITQRKYSQKVHTPPENTLMDLNLYEFVCSETLEELGDYFEEILENTNCLDSVPDVMYSDGVLTVKISDRHGTFVINRQTPNRQIWLSSPQSGPKRFDYVPSTDNEAVGKWMYKHSGDVLHELLQKEITPILNDVDVDFLQLVHSGKVST